MRWTDWVLLVAAACLVAVGPAMALQELAKAQDQQAHLKLTGTIPPPDSTHRAVWRLPLTLLVLVSSLFGAAALIRGLLDPIVRSVSHRLVALLIGSLALLDVTYVVDGYFFFEAPYALRGASIVWFYSLCGILLGGSAYRLGEVAAYFSSASRAARP